MPSVVSDLGLKRAGPGGPSNVLPARAVVVEADTRNFRRFWFVEFTRVTVLIGIDVATFLVVRSILEAVRIRPQGGNPVALVDWLFPPGFLAGWSFLAALILGLVISGAYGSGELRRDTGRIFAGVLLAALITL